MLSLRHVDQELEDHQNRSMIIGNTLNSENKQMNTQERKKVSFIINKTKLDSDIKDNLILKDLKLQEKTIESRYLK